MVTRLSVVVRFSALAVVVSSGCLGTAWGSSPDVDRDYPPIAREFVEVLTNTAQSQESEDELHEIVRRGLLDAPGIEVERFLLFLSEVSRWCDLTLFRDVLLSFDEATQRTTGAKLLDVSELDRMHRMDRKGVYNRVLDSGAFRLKYGTELDRYTVILRASQEGFGELYDLVVETVDTLPEEFRVRLDLNELEWRFRLREGASNREDGDSMVLNKFLDLAEDPSELEEGEIEAVQRVVTEAGASACDRGPMDAFDAAGCQEWRSAFQSIYVDLGANDPKRLDNQLLDSMFLSKLGSALK